MIFGTPKRTRKFIFRIVGVLIILFVFSFLMDFVFGSISIPARNSLGSDIRYYQNVIGENKFIALTFDDGPDPKTTPLLMEILKENNVPATFFFLGTNSLRYPEWVKSVHNEGFEIGNHTFTHDKSVHVSRDRFRFEVTTTNKILKSITGEAAVLYRPPFLLDIGGDPTFDPETPETSLAWAGELGYVVVGADIDSFDWKAHSADEVVANILARLSSGGHIVLLHDGFSGQYTVEALPRIISELRSRGYEFVTVSDLFGLNVLPYVRVDRELSLGTDDARTRGRVSHLQTFLLMEGIFDHEITGYFGTTTLAALNEWQAQNGVVLESGVLGPLTREKMASVLSSRMFQKIPTNIFSQDLASFESKMRYFFLYAISRSGGILFSLTNIALVFLIFRLFFILFLFIIEKFKKKVAYKNIDGRALGVSVVIPVHNEAKNIAATITSVLDNSHKNIEIIIVDDGSTDSTALIGEWIRNNYPRRISLIKITNGGKANALNIGIREASNEIVIGMDGDTVFEKDTIALLMRHFKDPQVAAVAGKVCVSDTGNLISLFQSIEYMVAQNIDKRAFSVINAIGVIPGAVGAWRKQDIVRLGGYSNDTLAEDQDLTLGLLAAGRRIVYEPLAIAYTEAPHTIKDFIRQRFRWLFGTLQCLWKYKNNIFSLKTPSLGFIVLPHTFVYTLLLSLLYPIFDVLFVFFLLSGLYKEVLLVYLFFTLVDIFYTSLGFISEKNKWMILLLPLQRIFYRFVIYVVMVRCFIKIIEGTEVVWGRVEKRGQVIKKEEVSKVSLPLKIFRW